MAKKSMIERDKRRSRLVAKYAAKREALKEEFRQAETLEDKLAVTKNCRIYPAIAPPTVAVTAVRLQVVPVPTTVTLAFAAMFYGNGPTRVFCPV